MLKRERPRQTSLSSPFCLGLFSPQAGSGCGEIWEPGCPRKTGQASADSSSLQSASRPRQNEKNGGHEATSAYPCGPCGPPGMYNQQENANAASASLPALEAQIEGPCF
ncbi:Tripartite Motif-Containing Protein 72 [Manis pentadactyla]|nr:Tripartite Motif-Containing Protein 72 [Manis pentadactyla]